MLGGFAPLFFYSMLSDSVYQRIEAIVLEIVPEAFLVDAELMRGKQSLLSIKVDTDKGISLQECTKISRKLGAWFEEEDVFSFAYRLEVSSPGVGTPLKLHRQYVKNIGRSLQVIMLDGVQKEGILKEVDGTSIVLTSFPKKKRGKKRPKPSSDAIEQDHILFSDIKQSKVIIM